MKDNQRSSIDLSQVQCLQPPCCTTVWFTNVENEEEKCPFPYYFHNLIFSTQQAVFKTFKRKKNIETRDPKPQRNRHNSAQRRQHHPEGDNHSGEEVNKTSCPTLHVFRVGICRRPMSLSPPPTPPPPVGC